MKTTSYQVQCYFNNEWCDWSASKTKLGALKQIKEHKRQDKAFSDKYDYRLVRVTTTREIVKG